VQEVIAWGLLVTVVQAVAVAIQHHMAIVLPNLRTSWGKEMLRSRQGSSRKRCVQVPPEGRAARCFYTFKSIELD